jgi:opacity protein-like surface antigen
MKNLILVTVFALISFTSFAQKETLFGGKVGVTLPGTVHAGFIMDHSFNKNFGFVGEVLFNQKITDVDTKVVFATTNCVPVKNDLKYTMNYLQVPLSLKVTGGNKVKPYAMAGVAVGYLLASSNNAEGKPAYPIYDQNVEWSYLGSVGIDYKPIFIELRYNAGFNPAVKINNGGRMEEYYNRNLMISVGFKL